jgi:hypothetical protein
MGQSLYLLKTNPTTDRFHPSGQMRSGLPERGSSDRK